MADEQIDGKSLNIGEDNIQRLKELFPQIFTEGKVDFNRLKDLLGEDVNTAQEYYTLNWAGKSEARREIQKQTTATLIPERDKSIDFDTTQNIFIEGENLETLRVLQKSYFGKVKMIYIDPPYNTGSDSFVYPDDYSERQEEYQKRTGITDEEGFLNKQDLWRKNTKESGQFHSAWLSMMYPRLYLARNLMREDGVIFVSIDDNEQANLKLMMDEIFGEDNFVGSIVRATGTTTAQGTNSIGKSFDYILAYSKSTMYQVEGITLTEKDILRYNLEDEAGKFSILQLRRTGNEDRREDRPSMYYGIQCPDGETVFPLGPTGYESRWRVGEKKFSEMKSDNLIYFKKDEGKWTVYFKYYLEGRKKRPSNLWTTVEGNKKAQIEIKSLFDMKAFDTPKPTDLVKKCLAIGTNGEDSLILDFFAGSGTTAEAVLEWNKSEGTNHKFICVQMPEILDDSTDAYKAGFKTISDITNVRIRKVIERLKSQSNPTFNFDNKINDIGLQSYRLAISNFKKWQTDIQGEDIIKQLELHVDTTKAEASTEGMLREILLKQGKLLTSHAEFINTHEGGFYHLPNYDLIVCLNGYGADTEDKILKLKPKQVVVLDKFFEKDESLSNARNTSRDAGIEKFTVI